MEVKVYTLNAFTQDINGGNPAGVVLNADNLSDNQMQEIAKKINFSETAFVSKTNFADYKVRFFTPTSEVDLCGHATIATFFLMSKINLIKKGNYKQETKAGILDIEVKNDNLVYMAQNIPIYSDILQKEEIADSLNITSDIFISDLPIQIVSTGLRDIFVSIKTLEDLNNIEPNFEKISQISKKYNVIGYHLFTLGTLFSSTAHCRNFAPLYDINEEAATGTSSGALSCYLNKYKKINGNDLIFEQGYKMNRPSKILASIKSKDNKILGVKVGGYGANIQEKKIILD
ncbi:MAG: PhzF family phenazine biosynthesis protein [Candidatus Gracilibacteria bacterium]|nr:PhzF family phenazine biosynthesis protein [Candidatus Gracilibacteria bacterium]